jgi:hypothetical protein
MAESPHSSTIIGWREWVSIPDLGVDWIKAKVDTGAATSSLHAFDLEDHGERVSFRLYPWQDSEDDARNAELPVHDRRVVRSSSGHEEERIVVLLTVTIADRVAIIETTLTNRDSMGFRMLVGREALRQGFLVDPAASFLGGRAPKSIRMANRGR